MRSCSTFCNALAHDLLQRPSDESLCKGLRDLWRARRCSDEESRTAHSRGSHCWDCPNRSPIPERRSARTSKVGFTSDDGCDYPVYADHHPDLPIYDNHHPDLPIYDNHHPDLPIYDNHHPDLPIELPCGI